MINYFFKRLFFGFLTIFFLVTVTFIATRQAFQNPLASDKALNEIVRKNLEKKWGLDKPIFGQYTHYIGNLLKGEFGYSMHQENRLVADIIAEHFPISAILGIVALIFAFIGGIFFGAISAFYRQRLPDFLLMTLVILGISVPSFVFASMTQLFILEVNQLTSWSLPLSGVDSWNHIIVPSFILSLGIMAFMVRLMRSSLLEIMTTEYSKTAIAKGLGKRRVFLRHQLNNAILPVVTTLGATVANITTGSFVIEYVFAIPGLGKKFVDAVQQQDYTLIMGTTVFYGTFLVLVILFIDLLYGLIDPRIRLAEGL